MIESAATVGFVGVGNMGWPMAACLVKAGFAVNVKDSRREIADNFVQQVGGFAPDSLRQLAEKSDIIVTMLPTSAIVERVLAAGDDNLLAGMKPGSVIIEMSSGVPSLTQRLAEQVAALGGTLIDAPVSGGVPRAKIGQLLAKDLSIAMQVGRETATAAPMSALVNELIVSAQAKFGPNADHTEMAKLCELLAGSELDPC